jgi:hypothetical protein
MREWAVTLGLLGALVATFALVAWWALRGWRWGPGLPVYTPPPAAARPPGRAGRLGAGVGRALGGLALVVVGAPAG